MRNNKYYNPYLGYADVDMTPTPLSDISDMRLKAQQSLIKADLESRKKNEDLYTLGKGVLGLGINTGLGTLSNVMPNTPKGSMYKNLLQGAGNALGGLALGQSFAYGGAVDNDEKSYLATLRNAYMNYLNSPLTGYGAIRGQGKRAFDYIKRKVNSLTKEQLEEALGAVSHLSMPAAIMTDIGKDISQRRRRKGGSSGGAGTTGTWSNYAPVQRGIDETQIVPIPIPYTNPVQTPAVRLIDRNTIPPDNIGLEPVQGARPEDFGIVGLPEYTVPNYIDYTIPRFAYGGQAVPVPVNMEGGETVEVPDGEVYRLQGRSHEQGGEDVLLPEGSDVYSKRIKIDNVSLADRKDKRTKRTQTLEELVDNYKYDKLLRNTQERILANNAATEAYEEQLQDSVGTMMQSLEQSPLEAIEEGVQTMNTKQKAAYGGKAKKPPRKMISRFHNNPGQYPIALAEERMIPDYAQQAAMQEFINTELASPRTVEDAITHYTNYLSGNTRVFKPVTIPFTESGSPQVFPSPISLPTMSDNDIDIMLRVTSPDITDEEYKRRFNRWVVARDSWKKANEEMHKRGEEAYQKKLRQRPANNGMVYNQKSRTLEQVVRDGVGLDGMAGLPQQYVSPVAFEQTLYPSDITKTGAFNPIPASLPNMSDDMIARHVYPKYYDYNTNTWYDNTSGKANAQAEIARLMTRRDAIQAARLNKAIAPVPMNSFGTITPQSVLPLNTVGATIPQPIRPVDIGTITQQPVMAVDTTAQQPIDSLYTQPADTTQLEPVSMDSTIMQQPIDTMAVQRPIDTMSVQHPADTLVAQQPADSVLMEQPVVQPVLTQTEIKPLTKAAEKQQVQKTKQVRRKKLALLRANPAMLDAMPGYVGGDNVDYQRIRIPTIDADMGPMDSYLDNYGIDAGGRLRDNARVYTREEQARILAEAKANQAAWNARQGRAYGGKIHPVDFSHYDNPLLRNGVSQGQGQGHYGTQAYSLYDPTVFSNPFGVPGLADTFTNQMKNSRISPVSPTSRSRGSISNTIDTIYDAVGGVVNNMNVTPGDVVGMYGRYQGYKDARHNTEQARLSDTPNINPFENYGRDSLRTLESNARFAQAERIKNQEEARRNQAMYNNRIQNNARSSAVQNALQVGGQMQRELTDARINDAYQRQIYANNQQLANAAAMRDRFVAQGEAARDLADRQDKDAYYTNRGQDIVNNTNFYQQLARDLNLQRVNTVAMNTLRQMSPYGFAYDSMGMLRPTSQATPYTTEYPTNPAAYTNNVVPQYGLAPIMPAPVVPAQPKATASKTRKKR